jgi:FkbM family methyltransferase
MDTKERVRRYLSAKGIHIDRGRKRGYNEVVELRSFLGEDTQTVFDVGANVGRMTREYLDVFPKCRVHCFEPNKETFTVLSDFMKGEERVRLNMFGLGAENRTMRFRAQGTSGQNAIAENDLVSEGLIDIPVRTLDDVCEELRIDCVDFIKVDTEGHDLFVLQGASKLFEKQAVRAVQVETTFDPNNPVHV